MERVFTPQSKLPRVLAETLNGSWRHRLGPTYELQRPENKIMEKLTPQEVRGILEAVRGRGEFVETGALELKHDAAKDEVSEPSIGAGGDYELRQPENKIVEMTNCVGHPVCSEPGCDFCEGRSLPIPLQLKHNAAFCPKDDCEICGKTAPHRFDPYEALDQLHDLVDEGVPGKAESQPIHAVVAALRAYITGRGP
jgi:hypothetical protein